ncbi:MAG: class I SAM-dependent methyltransferase [Curvibacter sp.]|nr:MAG: class I SAM-dependent methyltransferase [Curvibacter sp.]
MGVESQTKEHWEKVYQSKSADQVSWFQEHAGKSLEMIRSVRGSLSDRILDVGGGASTLVDDLLADGCKNVSVLDLSEAALEVAKRRLGASADRVGWIAGDIRSVALPEDAFDVWHDRAVFHFLTEQGDRDAYVGQVMRAVRPGGHVIVATFAPDGPEKCSGLPVMRYGAGELHGEFGPAFELVGSSSEVHKTPWGSEQSFVYCLCVKPR